MQDDEELQARQEEFARSLYSKTDTAAICKFVDLSSRQAEFMREVIRQRDEMLTAINKIAEVGAKNESFQKKMAEVESIAFSARRIVPILLRDANCEASNNDR